MNRSMEAHELLSQSAQYKHVRSFGTGKRCKLPGPSAEQPAVFDFGVAYKTMYKELQNRDARLYSRNGVLAMIERNSKVKEAPERWQDHQGHFDVVFTFERGVFHAVVEELHRRADIDGGGEVVQVINIETKDRKEEAETGAHAALHLARLVRALLFTLSWGLCMHASCSCALW